MGGGYWYTWVTSLATTDRGCRRGSGARRNPNLSARRPGNFACEQNSDDLGTPLRHYFGWGRVNAYKQYWAGRPE